MDPVTYERNGLTYLVSESAADVWFTCPNCGYDRVRFPTKPEAWKQYEADGVLTLKQDVVEYATIVVRSDENFLKGMALYIPAVVFSVVANQYGGWSPHIVTAVTVIGASILYVVAARHHLVWGMPSEESEQPEQHADPLPDVTEIKEEHGRNSTSLFRFSKEAVTYPSGDQVPDYMLWSIAMAWTRGTPFSKQLYSSESKVVSRPAFEAIRDAFIRSGIAYHDGQDIGLKSRARNVLRQWASYDRPTVVIDNPKVGTVVRK